MANEVIVDVNMFGDEDSRGFVEKLYDEDALTNSLRLWFSSKRGERFRRPTKGGMFMAQIDKLMGNEDISLLKSRIISALKNDYEELINPQQLTLTPNYNTGTLDVDLVVYASFLNKEVTFNESFNARF